MPFDAAISAEIWNAKYRFRTGENGGDSDIAATWRRVAAAAAEAEAPHARAEWRERFEAALQGESVALVGCHEKGWQGTAELAGIQRTP